MSAAGATAKKKKSKKQARRVEDRLGPSGDRITLAEFDAAIPAIRALVDEKLPLVLLGMQVDLLERSEDFDEAVADKILADPDRPAGIGGRKAVATAVAWCRARCGDRVPSAPPPPFLIEAAKAPGGSPVPEYLMAQLKKHHREVMGRFKPKDFQNPNEVNTRLRDCIVEMKDKPEIVALVWEKWPLFFEWVASWDRYSPENVAIQRDALKMEATGKMTASETRTYVFKKYDPRGHEQLERALMQEAMKKAAASDTPTVNLE